MPVNRLLLEKIQGYLSSDTNHLNFGKYMRLFFLAGVLIVISWYIYFACSTIINPYPIEYREGAVQVITQFLLNGQNPYSLQNQPLGMNVYGIGYPLFVWPFAVLFGNTLFIHRATTFLFLLLSFFLISKTVFRLNKNLLLAISCSIMIVIGLASRGGLGAFPSAMGAFLFLAGILIPFNRSFDGFGLILSGLFCLMAYYTKPYFMLSFGIVASYLFIFVSKKKGLLYSLFFILLLLFSYFIVRFNFKLYFIDTVLSNLGQVKRSMQHLHNQLWEMVREYYPSMVVAIVVLLLGIAKLNKSMATVKGLLSRLNILTLEEPLISERLNYFAYFFTCSVLVFIFILGPYPGSFMTYSYHLVVPPFFLWLFEKLKSPTRLALISMPLLVFNMIWMTQVLLNPVFLKQKDSAEWNRLYQYVDSSSHILNSPVIVSEMIRLSMETIDSGVSTDYYSIKPYPNNILLGPDYDTIYEQGNQYTKAMNDNIKNMGYDRLILTKGDNTLYPINLIGRYYSNTASLTVDMPQTFEQWTIEIWEPKGSIQGTNP